MSAREHAYMVCQVARRYPASWFWVFACTGLYAGAEDLLPLLAAVLFGQLWIIAHTVHHMWEPAPAWQAAPRRGDRHGRRDK